ncbi:hypothetical protein B0H10DRAFT_2237885 [Mycena sp. CBHHK59/15]|nr:hypothetical protein B0H10DRAFT_2237885 [Mycena sp. CBHHK59/15]
MVLIALDNTIIAVAIAIAGCGGTGLSTGTFIIIANTVPLEKPLIGGALTDKAPGDALQWGGFKYLGSDGCIIALFVLFGVLISIFIGIQIWKQDEATVPPCILKQWGIMAAAWFALWLSGSFLTLIYLLPIYFQAIKGVSA